MIPVSIGPLSHRVSAARAQFARRALEREQRERGGSMFGPALTATFLGLLVVQSMTAAGEESATSPGKGMAERGLPASGEDGAAAAVASPLEGGIPAHLASGSLLGVGGYIDPGALASLNGEARFDTGFAGLTTGFPPSGEGAAITSQPLTVAELSRAGTAALVGEVLETAGTRAPGEDVGPIGDVDTGTDGDDVITGTDDDDHLDGGAGDDIINAGGGDDVILGADGDDTLNGQNGDDTALGGTGNDVVDGGNGGDVVQGNAGDDALYGGAGTDQLDGGEGGDQIDGGTGDDISVGGNGDDTIGLGGSGDVAFENPWGDDVGGNDTMVVAADFGAQLKAAFPTLAKAGVVTFMVGDSVAGAVPLGAHALKQQIAPDIENVRLTGSEAHDIVGNAGSNVLEGNDGGNSIWGGLGDDHLRGGMGDDRLYGGDGDDLVLGDAGDDWIHGGNGEDQLYGGAGDDTYVMGLNDVGVHSIYDHEGSSRILLAGGDSSQLSARMEGSDLWLSYDGADKAVLKGYAASPMSFDGVELGNAQSAGFSDLLAKSASPAPADMLAGYMDASLAKISVDVTGGPLLAAADDDGLSSLQGSTAHTDFYAGAEIWMGADHDATGHERGKGGHG